ncbi:MAG TPA: MBL fold metallo-hydrolase [Patescibacteria group bacterium]|nr:MBL fold metallo-hydrolase [Patescibacteria group bacterium]
MHISWLGNTAFRLQTKPKNDEVTIVIDPYRPEKGGFPRNLLADIALYTHGEEGSITITGNPFVLSTPGECEVKGVLVAAVPGTEEGQTTLRIDTEQMSLGHLGLVTKPLTDSQLSLLSGVDILLIPVGGHNCYDDDAAVKAISAIEPRLVIPMAFQSENDPKANPIDAFLKEVGAPKLTPEKKLIIKKKGLPEEDMQVIVLEKE